MPRTSTSGQGRPKGARNKRTLEIEAAIAEAANDAGMQPLEYMLQVMRDETASTERRDDMAKAAAAFRHPRLASTEVKVPQKIVHEVRVTIAKP